METFEIVQQSSRMLGSLDAWLEKAVEHAKNKGFEADVLASARLAPDQYTLAQQVQSACDQAKYMAAYLAQQPAPPHPDTEKTIDELRARIRTCRTYVDGFKAADFKDPASVRVAPAWMGGKSVPGDRYLSRISVPNFHFHLDMAYAILRHNGVSLGKGDYLGIKDFSELGAE